MYLKAAYLACNPWIFLNNLVPICVMYNYSKFVLYVASVLEPFGKKWLSVGLVDSFRRHLAKSASVNRGLNVLREWKNEMWKSLIKPAIYSGVLLNASLDRQRMRRRMLPHLHVFDEPCGRRLAWHRRDSHVKCVTSRQNFCLHNRNVLEKRERSLKK